MAEENLNGQAPLESAGSQAAETPLQGMEEAGNAPMSQGKPEETAGKGEQAAGKDAKAEQPRAKAEQPKEAKAEKASPEAKPEQPGDKAEDAKKEDAKKEKAEGKDAPLAKGERLNIEGADPAMLASYSDMASDLGLSANQGEAIAKWFGDYSQKVREQLVSYGVDVLNREWGPNAENNRNEVLALMSRVDRDLAAKGLGDSCFSKAIADFGVDCSADFIRGMSRIAALLSEDSLGATAGSAGFREETPLEAMKEVLASYGKK